MTPGCVTPAELAGLGAAATVVDVREPAEFAGARWPGSLNVPLARLASVAETLPRDRPLVLVCRSGARARQAADALGRLGFADVRLLLGGLAACPPGALEGEGGAWAMERQVRMAAGALVTLGLALGRLVHPGLYLLAAFVGAGLMFSAATDTCGMARVLALMPWNRGRGAGCRR